MNYSQTSSSLSLNHFTHFSSTTDLHISSPRKLKYERCEIIADDRKFISLSLKEYIIVVVNFHLHQNIK